MKNTLTPEHKKIQTNPIFVEKICGFLKLSKLS